MLHTTGLVIVGVDQLNFILMRCAVMDSVLRTHISRSVVVIIIMRITDI